MQADRNQRGLMEPTTTEPPITVATPPEPRGLAPAWHTILFIALFCALSFGGTKRTAASQGHAHWPLYLETMVMQWLLMLYIAWGLRLRKRRFRDLIGGRWKSSEDVFVDIGIAIGFFIANLLVRAAIAGVLLAVNGNFKATSLENAKHVAKIIGPQGPWELLLFMGVALTAGFCEEVMFRGYLQQQFGIWTRSTSLGVVISAVFFCVGHAYQGWFFAVQVGLLGLMLGILAAWRKSLRPGMIAHAGQDIISGILVRLLLSGAK